MNLDKGSAKRYPLFFIKEAKSYISKLYKVECSYAYNFKYI